MSLALVLGGSSPQSASVSRSLLSTSPGHAHSAARTTRSFGPPTSRRPPAPATSSGPRIENSPAGEASVRPSADAGTLLRFALILTTASSIPPVWNWSTSVLLGPQRLTSDQVNGGVTARQPLPRTTCGAASCDAPHRRRDLPRCCVPSRRVELHAGRVVAVPAGRRALPRQLSAVSDLTHSPTSDRTQTTDRPV